MSDADSFAPPDMELEAASRRRRATGEPNGQAEPRQRHLQAPPARESFSGTKLFHNTLQIGKDTDEAEPKKDEGMLTPNLSFLINGPVTWIIRTPNGLTV
jgi:hypothetical protein